MGASPHRVVGCTIGTKEKGVKFFFNFFFVGCGCVGVGAWVRGCGRSGVGARVGMGAGWIERAEDVAGWIGIVAVRWTKSASLGFPIPKSDCRLGCDR